MATNEDTNFKTFQIKKVSTLKPQKLLEKYQFLFNNTDGSTTKYGSFSVFEPGAENEEELIKIHEAYKNLVDFMLGSYMEDLKISPDEFEKSCAVASKKALNQFHQNLFQQVWAADDFEIFKRMMTQKNLELQLQALEFLTQKRGSVPDCMEPVHKIKDEKEMEEIIKKVIEESDFESEKTTHADSALQEKMKQEAERERQLLEQALRQTVKVDSPIDSLVQPPSTELKEDTIEAEANIETTDSNHETVEAEDVNESSTDKDESKSLEENFLESPTEQNNANETNSTEQNDEDAVEQCKNGVLDIVVPEEVRTNSPPLKTLPPLRTPDERPWSEGDANVYTQVQIEVSPMELEKRQNYLRQQRDRILAMKKQERARRLSTSEEVITQARPKSAKAARKILREESTEVDPQTLAFRKSLAAKLRCEVIDKVD